MKTTILNTLKEAESLVKGDNLSVKGNLEFTFHLECPWDIEAEGHIKCKRLICYSIESKKTLTGTSIEAEDIKAKNIKVIAIYGVYLKAKNLDVDYIDVRDIHADVICATNIKAATIKFKTITAETMKIKKKIN